MSGNTWQPDRVRRVLALAAETGGDRQRVADGAGVTYGQLDNWISRNRQQWRAAVDGKSVADPVVEWEAKRDAHAASVLPRHQQGKPATRRDPNDDEWLQRVEKPRVAPPRVTGAPTQRVLVSSDHHWRWANRGMESVILQALAALRPRLYVLNGDLFDCLAISLRHPPQPRHSWTVAQECEPAHDFLKSAWEIMGAYGGELVVLPGNHEERWAKYLDNQVPHLAGHPKAAELWDYRRWFFPEDVPIRFADQLTVANGQLLITHGEKVRGQPGQSVRAEVETWHADVWMGHTHRAATWAQRVPAMPGRAETMRRGVEGGCCFEIGSEGMAYARRANWQNAFGVIHESADGWQPELVYYERGRAIVPSIGAELRAG